MSVCSLARKLEVVAGSAALAAESRLADCAPAGGAGGACLLQLHSARARNASLNGTGDFPADDTSEYYEFSQACRAAGAPNCFFSMFSDFSIVH